MTMKLRKKIIVLSLIISFNSMQVNAGYFDWISSFFNEPSKNSFIVACTAAGTLLATTTYTGWKWYSLSKKNKQLEADKKKLDDTNISLNTKNTELTSEFTTKYTTISSTLTQKQTEFNHVSTELNQTKLSLQGVQLAHNKLEQEKKAMQEKFTKLEENYTKKAEEFAQKLAKINAPKQLFKANAQPSNGGLTTTQKLSQSQPLPPSHLNELFPPNPAKITKPPTVDQHNKTQSPTQDNTNLSQLLGNY